MIALSCINVLNLLCVCVAGCTVWVGGDERACGQRSWPGSNIDDQQRARVQRASGAQTGRPQPKLPQGVAAHQLGSGATPAAQYRPEWSLFSRHSLASAKCVCVLSSGVCWSGGQTGGGRREACSSSHRLTAAAVRIRPTSYFQSPGATGGNTHAWWWEGTHTSQTHIWWESNHTWGGITCRNVYFFCIFVF